MFRVYTNVVMWHRLVCGDVVAKVEAYEAKTGVHVGDSFGVSGTVGGRLRFFGLGRRHVAELARWRGVIVIPRASVLYRVKAFVGVAEVRMTVKNAV